METSPITGKREMEKIQTNITLKNFISLTTAKRRESVLHDLSSLLHKALSLKNYLFYRDSSRQ